jgi:hypothetical protein
LNKINFLPLGSVVLVRGGVRKIMIVARAVVLDYEGEQTYFDYGACAYPEGLMGDAVLYFNHEDLNRVVFSGFSDDDDELMTENINEALVSSSIQKGDAKAIGERQRSLGSVKRA